MKLKQRRTRKVFLEIVIWPYDVFQTEPRQLAQKGNTGSCNPQLHPTHASGALGFMGSIN